MANVDPGASAATCRSVAAFASLVRYMLTPVEATTAGLLSSKPDPYEPSHQFPPASKSTGTKPQPVRDAEAEFDQAPTLPGLRARLIDLEHAKARRDLRPSLGEAVKAGAEDDVLAQPAAGLFHDEVFDETRTRHDRRAEGTRELRVHVAAAAPVLVRVQQLEADFVFQHMRRRRRPRHAKRATRQPALRYCLALHLACRS